MQIDPHMGTGSEPNCLRSVSDEKWFMEAKRSFMGAKRSFIWAKRSFIWAYWGADDAQIKGQWGNFAHGTLDFAWFLLDFQREMQTRCHLSVKTRRKWSRCSKKLSMSDEKWFMEARRSFMGAKRSFMWAYRGGDDIRCRASASFSTHFTWFLLDSYREMQTRCH